MKKFLLFAGVAALCSGAMFAQDDITPSAYKFYETGKMCPVVPYGVHGANIQNMPIDPDGVGTNGEAIASDDVFKNSGADKYYDNGCLLIGGGQYHNYPANEFYKNFTKGLQVVDLGGEVGTCFAFVAAGATPNAALSAATGREISLVDAGAPYNWGNMNFFTDPAHTPTAGEANIRVTITYNIFANTSAPTNAVNNIHFKTIQNGAKFTGGAMINTDCQTENEDTEEFEYDPSKWVKYSFVSNCPDADDGVSFAPMRLVLNYPGNGAATALFIRSITFETTSDDVTADNNETKTVEKLNMGAAGLQAIEAIAKAAVRVNGNVASFDGNAQVYNMTGALVGEGQDVTLNNGFYVAHVNGKAVKFVVK